MPLKMSNWVSPEVWNLTQLKNVLLTATLYCLKASVGSSSKESVCNAGDIEDVCSVPESGISPGGANGNLLQYTCLKTSMDRGAC